jgi:hypothetical protein
VHEESSDQSEALQAPFGLMPPVDGVSKADPEAEQIQLTEIAKKPSPPVYGNSRHHSDCVQGDERPGCANPKGCPEKFCAMDGVLHCAVPQTPVYDWDRRGCRECLACHYVESLTKFDTTLASSAKQMKKDHLFGAMPPQATPPAAPVPAPPKKPLTTGLVVPDTSKDPACCDLSFRPRRDACDKCAKCKPKCKQPCFCQPQHGG